MLTATEPTNNGTTRFFTAALSSGGAPATPLQAFRTVLDMTTGDEQIITAEAAIAVTGSTLSFKTTAAENTLIDPSNATEKRRVLIRAVFGVGDEFTDYADYTVRRIGLPV